tara:strand:+ start:887 stop:1618 length:732 start_codon:yes stop_codon:yes gene_type:complete
MGYCTRANIELVLAQSLTSATSRGVDGLGSLVPLIDVGNTLDNNLITNDVVDFYIQLADSETDATLSQLYKTPFCQTADFETVLFADIDDHNLSIVLEETCPLSVGDSVILTDGTNKEKHTIDNILTPTMFGTEDEIGFDFPAETRVIRVSYPDPIRYISARMSAATIYDKYFSAEVSPGTSKYGQYLREIARQDLNNILSGRTILHGQERIGRRFYNPTLVEQYGLPMGTDPIRDIDQLTKG